MMERARAKVRSCRVLVASGDFRVFTLGGVEHLKTFQ